MIAFTNVNNGILGAQQCGEFNVTDSQMSLSQMNLE